MAKKRGNKVRFFCNGKIIDINSPHNQATLEKVVFGVIDKMIEDKIKMLK